MERLTGNDAKNLMEAYSAVYAPQEISEDKIWEEVENWVNSLVEEGHDLSGYTWEEMYEAYIEEQGGQRGSGTRASQTNQSVSLAPIGNAIRNTAAAATGAVKRTATDYARGAANASRAAAGAIGSAARSVQQSVSAASKVPTASGPRNTPGGGRTQPTAPAPRPSNTPYQSRFSGARDAAVQKARTIQGSPVVGPRQPAPTASTSRPAAPSASKPAVVAKPAVSKTAPVTPATTTSTTSTPAPKKPSLASQAAELRAMRTASQQRQGLNQDFDVFDAIKGHLLDEGYADTEEAALKIMANMSEEWKQSILEADSIEAMRARAAKRRQQRYGKDGGGGYDRFRPYTDDDYKNPKPGYGSGASSQAKDA